MNPAVMNNPIQKENLSRACCLKRKQARGVALVTTLLLLSLMTVLTLAMVLAVSSDTLINGYYRNFRGAFYASDSGLNIARQDMMSRLAASVPATFPAGTPPMPVGTESSVRSALLSTYGSNSSITQGNANKSWPGRYRISDVSLTLAAINCSPAPPPPTLCSQPNPATSYQYIYNYSMTAVGQAISNEAATLTDSGSVIISTNNTPAGGVTTSFSGWGMFIDRYTACSGSYLVPGLISGPVFTNGAWTFGNTGAYIFTDQVGEVSLTSGFQFTGRCITSPNNSYTLGGSTISPTFQAGYLKGQQAVPLPTNDYNQRRAVLDGIGTGGTVVTNAEMNLALRNVSGTSYPLAGTLSGVWLPYSVDPVTGAKAFTGGGIYVAGDASVVLSTSGASGQVFTITQSGVTTTITVNPATNTTTVVSGATTQVISGIPNQKDPSTGGIMRPATMLYVNGSITALRGPSQGVAAINDGAAVTVTATTNITVTGDLIYKTAPVTKTQNQIPGTPPATLIPGNDNGQVLGIFTATGDIRMQNAQSNRNLEIDASLATISQTGTGGLINTGLAINTLTIIGGRIQNQIKNINSTTRNVLFDRRFAGDNFSPPWFPSTTITPAGVASATVTSSVQRVRWFNNSAY